MKARTVHPCCFILDSIILSTGNACDFICDIFVSLSANLGCLSTRWSMGTTDNCKHVDSSATTFAHSVVKQACTCEWILEVAGTSVYILQTEWDLQIMGPEDLSRYMMVPSERSTSSTQLSCLGGSHKLGDTRHHLTSRLIQASSWPSPCLPILYSDQYMWSAYLTGWTFQ